MTATENVTIVSRGDPMKLWEPQKSDHTLQILKRKGLPDPEIANVLSSSQQVLSRCVPPDANAATRNKRTGLVIGYVQSGKTLSFTALASLAKENGYQIVVIMAGTTGNLLNQNITRLRSDLGLDEGASGWRMYVNPSRQDGQTLESINQAVRQWDRFAGRPGRCRTLLIVVLKHHLRINNLAGLVHEINSIDSRPVLIIDDEGDQASLNTLAQQNDRSATYRAIMALRGAAPVHSYVQYTATPQAPLLISRIDSMSPTFATLIEPGRGYVGGGTLFGDDSPYIETIPEEDLPTDESDLGCGPPVSLQRALQLYSTGIACEMVNLDGEPPTRSMMIHPSVKVDFHQQFITQIREQLWAWQSTLESSDHDPDRRLLLDEFRAAYDDLSRTVESIPNFDAVVAELDYVIGESLGLIKEVNARGGGTIQPIDWQEGAFFILVGGTGLDRGFTVEGLTVTYMPRSAGGGNVDTIQQRGRFFGYKREYLGLIRIFTEETVQEAFRHYVSHERQMRESLAENDRNGRSLQEWRRAFFMGRNLHPTRRSVLGLEYMRERLGEWVWPARSFSYEAWVEVNRRVRNAFAEQIEWKVESMHGTGRNTGVEHLFKDDLDLDFVYRELLSELSTAGDPGDARRHIAAAMCIADRLQEQGDGLCDVYLLSKGQSRVRSLKDNARAIENPFQGRDPGNGYPGDRKLRSEDKLTIQIHNLELRDKDGNWTHADIPLVAVSIPKSWRRDLIIEHERA